MKVPDEIQFVRTAFQKQHTTDVRMDGKVVVLTGATAGVGLAAARRFADGGATLVLVCRNRAKGEALQAQLADEFRTTSDLVVADFAVLSDVRRAADEVLAAHAQIDVLINNAGQHRTTRTLTVDGNETVFAINHLASFLFTRLLLDRMIESAPSRIIQVNSEGHRFGGLDLDDLTWENRTYTGLKGYGASKVAQLLTVWDLADILEGTGVTINAMHPGAVRSSIGMGNGLGYRLSQQVFVRPFLKSPRISGEALYYLAAAPEMANVSGVFFNRTVPEAVMPHALDRELGRDVWRVSEELTGLPAMPLPAEKSAQGTNQDG